MFNKASCLMKLLLCYCYNYKLHQIALGELLLWELSISVKLLVSIIKFCDTLSKCVAMATKTSVKFSQKSKIVNIC